MRGTGSRARNESRNSHSERFDSISLQVAPTRSDPLVGNPNPIRFDSIRFSWKRIRSDPIRIAVSKSQFDSIRFDSWTMKKLKEQFRYCLGNLSMRMNSLKLDSLKNLGYEMPQCDHEHKTSLSALIILFYNSMSSSFIQENRSD